MEADPVEESGRHLKVPQINWNQIYRNMDMCEPDPWDGTFLSGIENGEYMYFVHSYYVKPDDPIKVLAKTCYGQMEFCSSLYSGNVFATQFHPERSGPQGLQIYQNIADFCNANGK